MELTAEVEWLFERLARASEGSRGLVWRAA